MAMLPNIHPGDVLREDYLEPLGKTPYWLAKQLRMTPTAVGQILKGQRRVTAETALRLSRLFGTSAEFWLNLQASFDLEEAREQMRAELTEIMPLPLPVMGEAEADIVAAASTVQREAAGRKHHSRGHKAWYQLNQEPETGNAPKSPNAQTDCYNLTAA